MVGEILRARLAKQEAGGRRDVWLTASVAREKPEDERINAVGTGLATVRLGGVNGIVLTESALLALIGPDGELVAEAVDPRDLTADLAGWRGLFLTL